MAIETRIDLPAPAWPGASRVRAGRPSCWKTPHTSASVFQFKPVRTGRLVLTGFFWALTCLAAGGQTLSVDPGRFGAMTCQQLWYVEQEVLAEGGVCLKTERARRAFRKSGRCISPDEDILPVKARDYLANLRGVARRKGCPGS